MSGAVELWDRFVATCAERSAALDHGVATLRPDELASPASQERLVELAYLAFDIACQSLLLGVEEVGKLALACERCLDLLRDDAMVPEQGLPILASSTYTLRRAFDALSTADRSGALVDPLPLEGARYELETLFPGPGQAGRRAEKAPDVPLSQLTRKRAQPDAGLADKAVAGGVPPALQQPPGQAFGQAPGSRPSLPEAPSPAASSPANDASLHAWVPSVAEDMVELFFEEAAERIEALSLKLIDVEQRPNNAELLRDVFRDLHTLKGSSAMVGLQPMNTLAHAAEDLVGQLRDGQRQADGAIIDALLAALDGLRDITAMAKKRQAADSELDLAPIVQRLRDPHAAPLPRPDEPPGQTSQTSGPPAGPGEEKNLSILAAAPAAVRQTIRVDFDKLDRLMNLVGELVLGRDRLRGAIHSLAAVAGELSSERQLTRRLTSAQKSQKWQQSQQSMTGRPPAGRAAEGTAGQGAIRDVIESLGDEIGRVERVLVDISQDLDHATGRLDSVSDDLRDQVMKLRMIPVGGVFRKHHRTVRDLAAALGKRVRLELGGEDTELDKLLVEALDEPLMHLVRNAVDHGIETPEARLGAGKSAEGTIRIGASHLGNQVVVRISDDGKGIDPEALRKRSRERGLLTEDELASLDDRQILDIIFRPGFSTATTVSQVSGRGVGMDVVRQAIVTQLKGTIDIESVRGQGTTFTLKLPLTLAIIQVLLARAGGETFAIPLDNVVRTLACSPGSIHLVQDREVLAVRGRQVPLIRLTSVLELEHDPYMADSVAHVVLTELGGELYGLICEHLVGKKEIVIKSLGDFLQNVPCAAGATLLGERCALILDVPAVIGRALRHGARAPLPMARPGEPAPAWTGPIEHAPHVLVVEDSDTVRESLRRLLVEAGYRCTVAADGVDGLAQATRQHFDLVSTDAMMPRMDGYELTRALRAMHAYKDTPIIMVTSRGERIDRVRGFDAGVDEYITKPHDRQLFLRAVRKLLAERSPKSQPDSGPGPHEPGTTPGRSS